MADTTTQITTNIAIFFPRQIDRRGLNKLNTHEEFKNNEHKKYLERVHVVETKRVIVTNVKASRL
jgi:hypothetical protein